MSIVLSTVKIMGQVYQLSAHEPSENDLDEFVLDTFEDMAKAINNLGVLMTSDDKTERRGELSH